MDRGFLIFFHVVRMIQGIIGIAGNSLVIIVILRFKTLNNSHVIIWSLAIADLLASVVGLYFFFNRATFDVNIRLRLL